LLRAPAPLSLSEAHMNSPISARSLPFVRRWLALLLVVSVPFAHANAPAPTVEAAKYEIRFMQDMIEHHMMAVHMSQICLEKAIHPELKAMCSEIISAQTAEIQQMQAWLATWYGVEFYIPMMKPGQEKQMERLASLAGAQFEIEFMQEMIRHHRGAIVEASQCLKRAYHDALLDMCANIIEAQLAEIRQMQSWLCSWYGICKKSAM
jgi:uncharacterized protein (DUF305 family)